MRRITLVLLAMAIAVVLASGVALAVTKVGTNCDDVLRGTDEPDRIKGRAGEDIILGLGDSDILGDGKGEDVIYGGAGKDRTNGNEGPDTVYGDGGRNKLDGGAGDNTLYGGPGNDELWTPWFGGLVRWHRGRYLLPAVHRGSRRRSVGQRS
jgi:Ca2+-binding RTX toxin-like protein